ncbi:Leucine-rich repeat-containing protein 56 [Durusdinium trenchii]|uniref:Leucine-rich repeat-containing protein 56 n=1 Tax=Durusdinium trenchii TaxID=1381693 RepID=A0ABP0RA49_9DINO
MAVPRLPVELAQQQSEYEELSAPSFHPEFLRHYCGTEELEEVTYLEMQVDSAWQSAELLGLHLPKLLQLKLTNPSSILSLRDLGSSLKQLEILWMSRCALQDLGGASALLPSLREFYLPFNDVADLMPLSGCERLEVLDLERNLVSDLEDVRALSNCPLLRELNLSGNPVVQPAPKALPRERILELLPSLSVLDDVPTKPGTLGVGVDFLLECSVSSFQSWPLGELDSWIQDKVFSRREVEMAEMASSLQSEASNTVAVQFHLDNCPKTLTEASLLFA